MEQGIVEVTHQETQKIICMLVRDVVKCFPYEFGELLRVVEYIVYNTPCDHGFTPRDIDRRWSVSSPLVNALTPFEVLELETLTQYVQRLFAEYRVIREAI